MYTLLLSIALRLVSFPAELGKDAAVLEILIGNRTAMDAIPDIQLADEKQNKLTALQSVCGQYLETL